MMNGFIKANSLDKPFPSCLIFFFSLLYLFARFVSKHSPKIFILLAIYGISSPAARNHPKKKKTNDVNKQRVIKVYCVASCCIAGLTQRIGTVGLFVGII